MMADTSEQVLDATVLPSGIDHVCVSGDDYPELKLPDDDKNDDRAPDGDDQKAHGDDLGDICNLSELLSNMNISRGSDAEKHIDGYNGDDEIASDDDDDDESDECTASDSGKLSSFSLSSVASSTVEKSISKVIAESLHEMIESHPQAALALLSDYDKKAVVSELVDGKSALYRAYQHNDHNLMTHIIQNCGADVDQCVVVSSDDDYSDDQDEATTLALAAYKNDVTGARLLVEHGASLEASGDKSRTALMLACTKGNIEIVKYLVDRGASLNAKDCDGNTPLLYACMSGQSAVAKFLVEKGVDVNITSNLGGTPLMACCDEDSHDSGLARCILDHGADVTCRDEEGDTVVMYAIYNNLRDLLQDVLERPCHVNVAMVTNNDGNTPLHEALAADGDYDVIKLLLEHGADPDAKDKHSKTCRNLASDREDLDVLFQQYDTNIVQKQNSNH